MSSDLTGGIKNALERNESLDKIKQTFLNAGYKIEEIESAIKETTLLSSSQITPVAPLPNFIKESKPANIPPTNLIPPRAPNYPPLNPTLNPTINQFQSFQAPKYQEEEKSNTGLIVLIVLSILILIAAGLAGLYWDKILGFFSWKKY